ncbi:MAG: DUF5681 domain-containing protein [Syntrophales bacterium]|jgi:hypothetical protein
MQNDNERPYEVGYGKPPQNTRFKPGHSGNPKGKPKAAKNLATIVNNAIKEKVAVNENGKRRLVSKLEIAVKQLVNKAAFGDQKALMQLLPLIQIIEGRTETDAASTPMLAEADNLVMAHIVERYRQSVIQEIAGQHQQPKTIVTGEEEKS